MDPVRPSDDSRLDALVARATQVAVERHTVASPPPRRSHPVFIGLAILALAAVGGGFIVAARDSGESQSNSNSTAVAPASFATTPSRGVSSSAESTTSTPLTTVAILVASTDIPTTSTASTTSTVSTSPSTTPPTTTPATLTSTVATTELLTGPPSMQLPGGQPWPNGLYQDNIMYLRGTVPSEEVGGDLQRRAEEILGAENVRNELLIDPSVPKVETVIVRLGNSVLFKSGDFDIPPESEPGFLLWAAFLEANPSVSLTVIGHADSRGTPESNQQLALQRAQVAADRITRNGIDGSRVTAVSRGADDPIAVNETQEGRALNRRVEFAVTGLLSE